MQSVKQILEDKKHSVVSVMLGTSVHDALVLMGAKNIGAVLVMDGSRLVGIFSERDYARKSVGNDKPIQQIRVVEMMSSKLVLIKPESTIQECMALMTDRMVRHLPEIDENHSIIGLISMGDVVKSMISYQEFEIQQLVNYISGNNSSCQLSVKW